MIEFEEGEVATLNNGVLWHVPYPMDEQYYDDYVIIYKVIEGGYLVRSIYPERCVSGGEVFKLIEVKGGK